ncbi:MAG: sigma-70 family RNA polymerase sigma factor [Myxococcota bacterium]
MEHDDSALLARVLATDDRHAFAQLVRRHQSQVRAVLRRLTGGDEALTDDLAQETFLRAYRGLARYRAESKFSTWLYRIATNVFLSNRRRIRLLTEAEVEVAAPANLLARDFRHDLERAMLSLPEQERTAIALAYAEEATHEDIAEVMALPLGTVKSAILRGKEKLRRRLRAWAPAAGGSTT